MRLFEMNLAAAQALKKLNQRVSVMKIQTYHKIAPFGKEDTAKELQDHAAKTQDTLVDAVENAEVAHNLLKCKSLIRISMQTFFLAYRDLW